MRESQDPPSDVHLQAVARRAGCDQSSAEDVVQEFRLLVFELGFPKNSERTKWSFGVVRNKARRERRSQLRRERLHGLASRSEVLPSTHVELERTEILLAIERALLALPKPGRLVIQMRYRDDIRTADIARLLEVPLRTVESRLRRSKARLRELLCDHAPERVREAPGREFLGFPLFRFPEQSLKKVAARVRRLRRMEVPLMTVSTKVSIGCVALLAIGWFARDLTFIPESPGPTVGVATVDSKPSPLPGRSESASLRMSGITSSDVPRRAPENELQQLREQLTAARQELARMRNVGALVETRHADQVARVASEDPFDRVDWPELGKLSADLMSLAPSLMKRGVREEDRMKYAYLATKLYSAINDLAANGWPRKQSGKDTVLSHPAFVAALIRSTLSAASVPLSSEQSSALDEIAQTSQEQGDINRSRHGAETLALEKIMEEVSVLESFYRQVDPLLSEEQHTVLHPAPIRGRLSVDLFQPGAVWRSHIRVIRGTERSMNDAVLLKLILAVPSLSPVFGKQILSTWLLDVEERVQRVHQEASSNGTSGIAATMEMYDRPKLFVEANIRLYESIFRSDLDESVRQAAREARTVLIPMRVTIKSSDHPGR